MQLQGLSPTQRSARATPSRDLTFVVVQQKEPQKTISPEIPKVQSGKTQSISPVAGLVLVAAAGLLMFRLQCFCLRARL